MNIVMTGAGAFVEVQGTAEGAAFSRAELDALLALGEKGCADLTRLQQEALAVVSRVFLASRNAKKLAEMERILRSMSDLGAVGRGARARRRGGVRRAGRGPADLRGQRAAQGPRRARRTPGCRRSPTTPGSASTRSTACPACSPRAGPGPPKADDRNNELLLAQLADVPDERRGAHFVCAVALLRPRAASEHVVEGRMDGRIIREAAGHRRLRLRRGLRRRRPPGPTTAELSVEDKDAISHRGKALRQLAPLVARLLGSAG